ncbi:MAG: hypothetical protein AAGF12_34465 [Myxococcota bacterium]
MTYRLVLFIGVVAMASACTSNRGRGGGGNPRPADASVDRDDRPVDNDASTDVPDAIVIPDATPDAPSTGCSPANCPAPMVCVADICAPECDAARRCATNFTCEDGRCVPDDPPPACPSDVIPRVNMPLCAATTLTCLQGCGSDTICIGNCYAADPSPDCEACVNQNNLYCFNVRGCQMQWDCFSACAARNGCMDRTCVELNCAAEDTAYSNCVDGIDGSLCSADVLACFP